MNQRFAKSSLIDPELEANQKGNIKYFLQPYFSFRLYVLFSSNQRKAHFYGNEHDCTYQQLRHGNVPCIRLDKLKGYTDLLNLVERTWKGKLTKAAIYMRQPGEEKFTILCRRWYLGKLEECQDPVLDENSKQILWYSFEKNRLHILTTPPPAIDFKSEVQHALGTSTQHPSTGNP